MALSRFDVAFKLQHNGKVVLHLPSVASDDARRLKMVCGDNVPDNSLYFDTINETEDFKYQAPERCWILRFLSCTFLMLDKLVYGTMEQ